MIDAVLDLLHDLFSRKPKAQEAIPYRAYVLAPNAGAFRQWQAEQLDRRTQGLDWWDPSNAMLVTRPEGLRGLAVYEAQVISVGGGIRARSLAEYDEYETALEMATSYKRGKALGE